MKDPGASMVEENTRVAAEGSSKMSKCVLSHSIAEILRKPCRQIDQQQLTEKENGGPDTEEGKKMDVDSQIPSKSTGVLC